MLTACKSQFCAEAAEDWVRGLDLQKARYRSLVKERRILASEALELATALLEMFNVFKDPHFTLQKAQQLRSEIEPEIQKRIQKYAAMKAGNFNT